VIKTNIYTLQKILKNTVGNDIKNSLLDPKTVVAISEDNGGDM